MQAAGMALRLFREWRGLGQEEASLRVGLNKNQAGRWERGEKRGVILDNLAAYAESIGAPLPMIVTLYTDKTATPIKGLRAAAAYLLKNDVLSEEEIQRLNAWRSTFGDQAVREALGPELDED
jgi:transcriptional regulator with XRE-family HTH domain